MSPPEKDDSTLKEKPRLGILGRIRNYFFAGFLITIPITATLYLFWVFIDFVDSKVTPLIPDRYNPEVYLPFSVPGLGLIVLFAFLTLIGMLTTGYLSRIILKFYEGLLARIPVVRSVYSALRQITETILSQKSNAFRQAVMVEYPRPGLWVIAFITATTEGEVKYKLSGSHKNIFIPTTPNPTSGFLLFAKEEDLIPLDMTVEEALKMVISGGLITPSMPSTQISSQNKE